MKAAVPFVLFPYRRIASFSLAFGMALAPVVAAYAAPIEAVTKIVDLTKNARVLLIGEMHGTQETPEFVIQIVDQWIQQDAKAETSRPVIVGLEYPLAETDALDAYLGSDGGPQATKKYMESPFWNRRSQDGRSSQSMFALIEAMRQRIKRGIDIQVKPFDMNKAQATARQNRDQAMADNLRAVVAAAPSARVVALMGNYHARKRDGAPWNPTYRFMGGYLQDLSPFSVVVGARRGAYWACTGQTPADCKATSFEGDNQAVGIYADTDVKESGYDLKLRLDRFSASHPAASAK